MEGLFQEFENENSLRSYPFAAGCEAPESSASIIPSDIFVDAAIYPINPTGQIYLSEISEDGVFGISDDTGVIMTGRVSGACVEFMDVSGLSRHVGTMVASSEEALEEFANRGVGREFAKSCATFAAGCVFPVIIDGITSIDVSDSGMISGEVAFGNGSSDDIRVSSAVMEDGNASLRFDVIPRPAISSPADIRRIICVVDGRTPFRIRKLFNPDSPDTYGYNTIVVSLSGIDRDGVCASSDMSGGFEMFDTCECNKPPLPDGVELPEAYQLEEVFIPPDEDGTEGGVPTGAENAFYMAVPNYYDENGVYVNPLSITLEDAISLPSTGDFSVRLDGLSAYVPEGGMRGDATSRGVVIQVPGISGGNP